MNTKATDDMLAVVTVAAGLVGLALILGALAYALRQGPNPREGTSPKGCPLCADWERRPMGCAKQFTEIRLPRARLPCAMPSCTLPTEKNPNLVWVG